MVYGLFGYVWMKGRHEPEQGMALHPNNVSIMLFWLVLCMTGAWANRQRGALRRARDGCAPGSGPFLTFRRLLDLDENRDHPSRAVRP